MEKLLKSYFPLVLVFCFSQIAYANYTPYSTYSIDNNLRTSDSTFKSFNSEQSQRDLKLKQYINEYNAIDNVDNKNDNKNDNKKETLSDNNEKAFSYQEDNNIDPNIQTYLDGLLNHLKEDVDLLTTECGIVINTAKEQMKFNQCFEKNKEQLKNPTFKYSAALSLAFLNKEQAKRKSIAQDFVTLYQQQLKQISSVAKQAQLPEEAFQQSLTLFYIKLVKEAYQKNQIIINNNKELTRNVNLYFIQLTHDLDTVLKNITH